MNTGKLWRLLGLGGVVGVAATGAIIARDQRRRAQLTPTRCVNGSTSGSGSRTLLLADRAAMRSERSVEITSDPQNG